MQAEKTTGGKRGRAPGVTDEALTFAFDYLQPLALVLLVLSVPSLLLGDLEANLLWRTQ